MTNLTLTEKKFVRNFVTAVTKFLTHVTNFVIRVTKFVTKISYKIVKTFKGKGKNCLGIIRFVCAQKVSPKAACNEIFHYGSLRKNAKA